MNARMQVKTDGRRNEVRIGKRMRVNSACA
jgi:hypothetical protein